MPKQDRPIIFEEKEGVAFIRFNRPEKKNAINAECWQLFDTYFQDLASRTDIRALVITGNKAGIFSAGVDVNPSDPLIARLLEALQAEDRQTILAGIAYMQKILTALADLPLPTIAAIDGACYSGGLELCLACDIRIASQSAELCFQETRLGLIPDLGGTVRLARLVGPSRAKDLIFSARILDPDQALAMGLVNHVFPSENFMQQVALYVADLLANSPRAIQAVKQIISDSLDLPLDVALKLEQELAADTILSSQCIEGVGAFLEKREPHWLKKSG